MLAPGCSSLRAPVTDSHAATAAERSESTMTVHSACPASASVGSPSVALILAGGPSQWVAAATAGPAGTLLTPQNTPGQRRHACTGGPDTDLPAPSCGPPPSPSTSSAQDTTRWTVRWCPPAAFAPRIRPCNRRRLACDPSQPPVRSYHALAPGRQLQATP
jgi:hypothetical protein